MSEARLFIFESVSELGSELRCSRNETVRLAIARQRARRRFILPRAGAPKPSRPCWAGSRVTALQRLRGAKDLHSLLQRHQAAPFRRESQFLGTCPLARLLGCGNCRRLAEESSACICLFGCCRQGMESCIELDSCRLSPQVPKAPRPVHHSRVSRWSKQGSAFG